MDNKFNAVNAYRAQVSQMIHCLLLSPSPGLSITQIASILHITIGQCSKVYHGCCSLSPERFLKLFSVFSFYYGQEKSVATFVEMMKIFENGTL